MNAYTGNHVWHMMLVLAYVGCTLCPLFSACPIDTTSTATFATTSDRNDNNHGMHLPQVIRLLPLPLPLPPLAMTTRRNLTNQLGQDSTLRGLCSRRLHQAKNCECFTCYREIHKLPPMETHKEYVTSIKSDVKRAKKKAKKDVKSGTQSTIKTFFQPAAY